MSRLLLAVSVLVVTACTSGGLVPANVAAQPGGSLAVSFTRTFSPDFWEPGGHAYRLVVVCPAQRVGPPVVRFEVTEDAAQAGTVYLRFDGPGRNRMSPADLPAVHPDDTTVAIVTLAGMTEGEAIEAQERCDATVIYDGLDPEPLEPGPVFSP